ncbi:hypothetical protein M9H77_27237 [Catharanthus roseus]|uniref:Uncharacterized protein n=1 Tax=Catharanthus roseus TaxID=4058 RepID=A0ACC0ACU2_CATRO|nr:hypothetical protein M9H77_27237 [Catharanthus roseus]
MKVKNANIGRGENVEEGESSRRRTGKRKRVASGVKVLERFISVKEAANFEEWTRKRRKIAPGHIVDLSDMEGMEIIPIFLMILDGDPCLLWMNFSFLKGYMNANLHKGRIQKHGNITHQWVISRVDGKDISFDDRLLNTILETPDDGIRFYIKNKKCFDPNLYSERRFEEIFTKGKFLKVMMIKMSINLMPMEDYCTI